MFFDDIKFGLLYRFRIPQTFLVSEASLDISRTKVPRFSYQRIEAHWTIGT